VLGLLSGSSNPAKEEEREFLNVIYHYHPCCFALHSKAAGVLIFVLGLPLGTSNPAKEEEREFLNVIYHYHPARGIALPLKGVNFLPDLVTTLYANNWFWAIRVLTRSSLGGENSS
jgi:hypothetical protein